MSRKRQPITTKFRQWQARDNRIIFEMAQEIKTALDESDINRRREWICSQYENKPWVQSLVVCDREKVLGDIDRGRCDGRIVLEALYTARNLRVMHEVCFDRLEDSIRERLGLNPREMAIAQ